MNVRKPKPPRDNDYLNMNTLLEKYDPLIKSVYNKFSNYSGLCSNSDDREDLKSQIMLEFVRLVQEYTPSRGVDFPGYVKMLLQQRVYHHVTKLQRISNNESVSYSYSADNGDPYLDFDNLFDVIDEDAVYAAEKAEALASIDWDSIGGNKNRELIEKVMYKGKTLEEIAEEEGITVKTIRIRLHAVCKKLEENNAEREKVAKTLLEKRRERRKTEERWNPFDNNRIIRKPIILPKHERII